MTNEELIKFLNVGVLTRELIKLLEDLLDNIEDDSIYEIVEYYQNALLHFSKIFVEKMLPKIKSERN